MSFKAVRVGLLLVLTALVSACGGGGGSGNDSGFNPPGAQMTATPASHSVAAGVPVDVTVRLTDGSGNPVANGTTVTGSVSPASVGNLFGVDANGVTTSNTATTSGGNASFRFIGQNAGTATLSFSAPDPTTAGRTISAQTTITVSGSASRVTIEATRDTLPINAFNVDPFVGSPYLTELTITVRDAAGNLVNKPDGVAVSVNPVGNTGGFSTLDDPETQDVNEFFIRLGQGPVDVVAGKATVFLHSLNFAGTTTVTVTTTDDSGQTFQASKTFTIVSGLSTLPANVSVSSTNTLVYVPSTGARSSTQIAVSIEDAIGQPVPDPEAGNTAYNNFRAELISTGGDAGRLVGSNASGQQVSGGSIDLRTVGGIGSIQYIAGNDPGQYRIRVTADRADNNVDNGIQDAVVGEATITVSDGKLFSLQITSPVPNAILVNRVDTSVTPNDTTVPPDPNGTYSLRVSVLATDRFGNPVPPNTEIQFGLVDDPVVGFPDAGPGTFAITDVDGNPQEGGFLFTAQTPFTTSAYPFGPSDTLLLFTEEDADNRDLESARTIQSVNSASSLNVVQRFNLNNDSGSTDDNGFVIPYVIGRATSGTIPARGFTDENGVASVVMTYPVNAIGKTVAIWARGATVDQFGNNKLVTDVEQYVYPGVADLVLIASPAQIQGNRTTDVTVCLEDAVGHPVAGAYVRFGFEGVAGSIDGQSGSGYIAAPTGFGGCTTGTASTTGVLPDSSGTITFNVGEATDSIEVLPPGQAVLQLTPSAIRGDGRYSLSLRLYDGDGQPIVGSQLVGSCEQGKEDSLLAIIAGPGATDSNGRTTATVDVCGYFSYPGDDTQVPPLEAREPFASTCEFSTASGEPTVTLNVSSSTLGAAPASSPAVLCGAGR